MNTFFKTNYLSIKNAGAICSLILACSMPTDALRAESNANPSDEATNKSTDNAQECGIPSLQSLSEQVCTYAAPFPECADSQEQSPSQRSFGFFTDIDIFRFDGQNLPTYKNQINAAFSAMRDSYFGEFKDELNFFFNEVPEIRNYRSELIIKTHVFENTLTFFSAAVDVYSYHHGACGCQSHIETFNFKIENGEAKLLSIGDIVPTDDGKRKLLKIALQEIGSRDGLESVKEYAKDEYLKTAESPFTPDKKLWEEIKFAIKGDVLRIYFPAYSIACGAAGILHTDIPYPAIESVLSQSAKDIFKSFK